MRLALAAASTVLGCVLAGGRASRLGRPKAGAPLGGRPLIARPLAALADAGLEAVVVAKRDTELPPLDVPVWLELPEPRHPLAGVAAALERAGGRAVLAVACDMPFLEPALLRHIAAARGPAAVPRAGGRLQPLCARYEQSALDLLRAALAEGRSMHATVTALGAEVLEEEETRRFGDPARMFFNVNTENDLEAASRILAGA